jgi:hypothetical protein
MHSRFRPGVWFSLNQMGPRTVSWNRAEWWVPVLPWGSMTAERLRASVESRASITPNRDHLGFRPSCPLSSRDSSPAGARDRSLGRAGTGGRTSLPAGHRISARERLHPERRTGVRSSRAVLCGTWLRGVRRSLRPKCPPLLPAMGSRRKGAAARPAISAPQAGKAGY